MFSCGVLCFVFCVCVCVLSVVALCYRAFLSGFLSGFAVCLLSLSFLSSVYLISESACRESPCHPVTLSHCTLSPLVSVRDPLSHTVGHCGKLRVSVAWLWGAVAWLWVAVFSCVLLCLCAFVPGYSVRHCQISTSGLPPEHNPPGSCPPEDAVCQEGLPHKL